MLYVGITVNPGQRFRQHQDEKPWWSEVATITIETVPSRAAVLEAELQAIRTERPAYNVIGAPVVLAAPSAEQIERERQIELAVIKAAEPL